MQIQKYIFCPISFIHFNCFYVSDIGPYSNILSEFSIDINLFHFSDSLPEADRIPI